MLELNPAEPSVLAESALMIADKNDTPGFALAAEYANHAIDVVKGTPRPDRMSRAEFQGWKTTCWLPRMVRAGCGVAPEGARRGARGHQRSGQIPA